MAASSSLPCLACEFAAGSPMAAAVRMPVVFLPHGGGPCFQLPDGAFTPRGLWLPMRRYLEGVSVSLPAKPAALLVCVARTSPAARTCLCSHSAQRLRAEVSHFRLTRRPQRVSTLGGGRRHRTDARLAAAAVRLRRLSRGGVQAAVARARRAAARRARALAAFRRQHPQRRRCVALTRAARSRAGLACPARRLGARATPASRRGGACGHALAPLGTLLARLNYSHPRRRGAGV